MHVVFWHAHRVGTVHTACLALSDHSCQTDDTNLILRIENGPDRNYPRWWQSMHNVCISQSTSWLLCSILLLSVSLPFRSALFSNKWWSFERRVVSAYNVCLHILCIIDLCKGMRFSSSVTHLQWSEDCFCYCSTRNNVVVLFGTLKVQSFILTEVSDCGLLIVVTSSTFLKSKNMLKAGFLGPSRCLIPTPGLTSKHPICAVCVCVCVYEHTRTHTLPPALKIEKTQTTPLSFLLSKITPHAKQQSLS